MTASSLCNAFQAECDRAIALVNAIESARAPAGRAIPALQRNLVFETAFLRILLGWESFLEDVFLHYLTGRPGTGSGRFSPIVRPRSIDIARRVVQGDREYIDWTSAAKVKARAKHWLGSSDPFDRAFQGVPALKDMYRVRNRIAHASEKSKAEFAAARSRLVPNRSNYKGFGPGMVLRNNGTGNVSNLDRFAGQLKNAATRAAAGP